MTLVEAPHHFAVATFGRVYDMTPQGDALTLDELASALTRFQLKTQLGQRIDKGGQHGGGVVVAVLCLVPIKVFGQPVCQFYGDRDRKLNLRIVRLAKKNGYFRRQIGRLNPTNSTRRKSRKQSLLKATHICRLAVARHDDGRTLCNQ